MLRATAIAASSSDAFGWTAAEGDDDDEGGSDEEVNEADAAVAETFPQSAA